MKNFFSKYLTKNHMLWCVGIMGGGVLLYAFVPSFRNLGWSGLIFLACPLMHVFMMGSHDHSGHKHGEESK